MTELDLNRRAAYFEQPQDCTWADKPNPGWFTSNGIYYLPTLLVALGAFAFYSAFFK